ncbi:mitochondrial import inner membrane translocase subunit TIM50 [Nematocida minor]|uniref:mitochondrial import inner membrane translocase subunit TIM50 n=1 Tax=Nematocida minor TaxID=1912983 RepID=UPI0022206BB1|nr:mitochondrial import inner membrane translocase subunit TIM50 [Nematocida minor]KAI5191979.1 mitochondrial import inner membrane translocase subunit TIM50 [Nematocida minor]
MGALKKYFLEYLPAKYSIADIHARSTMKMPKYSLGIGALLLSGLFFRSKTGGRVLSEMYKIGFADKLRGEELPEQGENKLPTVLIDIEDILLSKTWSFAILGYEYKIRPNAEAFLFQLSNEYEIVGISSLPNEMTNEILLKLDPYGCIKYRMHVPNRDKLNLKALNRNLNSLIRVRSKSESENDLSVDKWDGFNTSNDLMSLLDFLLNLKQISPEDFTGTIQSYKNKPFTKKYEEDRKTLYPLKRQYILFKNPNAAEEYAERINRKRIEEYEVAKEYIENQMRIDKIGSKNK